MDKLSFKSLILIGFDILIRRFFCLEIFIFLRLAFFYDESICKRHLSVHEAGNTRFRSLVYRSQPPVLFLVEIITAPASQIGIRRLDRAAASLSCALRSHYNTIFSDSS